MPKHVVGRLVDQRLDIDLVLVGQRQVDHDLDRMLAARLGELVDRGIVPVDALHREQVGIVGLARIRGRRTAALEDVVARLHRAPRPRPARGAPTGRASFFICSASGRRADRLPRRQDVERQVGLQREDGVDRARRALAEHAAAGGDRVVDVLGLVLPARGIVALLGRQHAEHDRPLVGPAPPCAAARGRRDGARRSRYRARPGRCRHRARPSPR